MIAASELDALLPHAGPMRLITEVRAWDERSIACAAATHRAPDHPLRAGGRLPAVCGLEYGAQAMAIHGALRAGRRAKPRVGYLVAAHELAWTRERLDDVEGVIQIRAECLLAGADRVAYAFWLHDASGAPLVTGRASVVLSA